MDWEKFGYYLLAGEKEQLIEVATNYCSCSLLLSEFFESYIILLMGLYYVASLLYSSPVTTSGCLK